MSAHILPRPGRHAEHRAPSAIELVLALIAPLCIAVAEHEAVHHVAVFAVRAISVLGSVAAVILLGVTP